MTATLTTTPVAHEPAVVAENRTWALAGLGAALTSIVGTGSAIAVDAVYDRSIQGDADSILTKLGDQVVPMVLFHGGISIAAILLVVFAFGLVRRLRAALPAGSIVPGVAGFGLAATAVVWVMGGALDTEFIFGVAHPESVVPSAAAVYNHWIGTVPGCTMLAGLAGLGVFAASRRGGAPRWLGRVGLVLGGLTLLLGTLPVQYMAGLTTAIWLLVSSIGFAFGDRAHRRA